MSDYAVELLTELATRARIRVVAPPSWEVHSDWSLGQSVEVVATDTRPEADEISLIHLGNNLHHSWLLDRIDDPLAVVVLHDLVLHHLLVETTMAAGAGEDLQRHLVAAHGDAGAVLAHARSYGLSGPRDPFLFPARSHFLERARFAVVHSRWADSIIQTEFPSVQSRQINLPALDPGPIDREAQRSLIGAQADDVVIMHLGFLTPEKGLREVLTGLAAAVRSGVPARLILVGQGDGLDEILIAAEAVGIGDRVQSTGFLGLDDFIRVPAGADVGVVLRTPSAGETSAAVVRFLSCGTPVAVVGLHQFLEWPETAAPRITPGPSASADLARLLAEIAVNRDGWTARRRSARACYETSHRPRQVAEELFSFLETVG